MSLGAAFARDVTRLTTTIIQYLIK